LINRHITHYALVTKSILSCSAFAVLRLRQVVFAAGEPEDSYALTYRRTTVRLSQSAMQEALQQLVRSSKAPENSPRKCENSAKKHVILIVFLN